MRTKLIWLVTVFAAFVMLAINSNDDATKIKWQPKVGAIAKYEIIDIVETPFGTKVKHEYSSTAIVDAVSDGEVILKFSSTEPKMTSDGPTGCPIKITGPKEKVTFAANGRYLGRETGGNNPMAARFGNLGSLVFPQQAVKVGESWEHIVEADRETGAWAGKGKFTYLGLEQIGKWQAHKMSIDYAETGGEEYQRMSAKGTTWVAVDDGMIVREQLRLTVPYGVEKIYIEAEKKRVE